MSVDSLKQEAQEVLDELFRENRIPFELSAREIIAEDSSYTVRFHDSRLRSVKVSAEEQDFKEAFRTAVLDGVSKLSGPLKKLDCAT